MRLNHKGACTRMTHASAVLTESLQQSMRNKKFGSRASFPILQIGQISPLLRKHQGEELRSLFVPCYIRPLFYEKGRSYLKWNVCFCLNIGAIHIIYKIRAPPDIRAP